MKAVLCKEFGPPETLVVEDIASPEPGPGQVVLDVHAAAVNLPINFEAGLPSLV